MTTEDPLFDFFTCYNYASGFMENDQLNFLVVTDRLSDPFQWTIGFTMDQLKESFVLHLDYFTGNCYFFCL